MTKLQAATDTFKELIAMYAVLLSVAAGVFSFAEGASIGDSYYWAATTATLTGYGDLSPKTWIGKLDAVLLMHGSIFFIAPMVVVRLIEKVNIDRDAFTHDEQEAIKAEIRALRIALEQRQRGEGADSATRSPSASN